MLEISKPTNQVRWQDVSPLLLSSAYVFIRFQQKIVDNINDIPDTNIEACKPKLTKTITINGRLPHLIYDLISLGENALFVIVGTHFMEKHIDNEHTNIIILLRCIVIVTHIVGLWLKWNYYQYRHQWTSLSSHRRMMDKCLMSINAIVVLSFIGCMLWLGIFYKHIWLTITSILFILLVSNHLLLMHPFYRYILSICRLHMYI